jgi:hypothetical protein
VVDSITHVYLRIHKFQFFRASVLQSISILPPRPQAFVAPQHSPAPGVSYWHRPHTSRTRLPILFFHGIGVGLYPYMEFLKDINTGHHAEDGTIGILAIEILPVSSRITGPMVPKEELCQQYRAILDLHGYKKFVLVSHSSVSPSIEQNVCQRDETDTAQSSPRISSKTPISPVGSRQWFSSIPSQSCSINQMWHTIS